MKMSLRSSLKSKFLVLTSILALSFPLGAQINVGSNAPNILSAGDFEPGIIDRLKGTKTVFVYRNADLQELETFKNAMDKAWNLTDLEFMSWEDYNSYDYDEFYSFMTISGTHLSQTMRSGVNSETTHIYLRLWMENEEDEDEDFTFFRIELYPVFEVYQKASLLSEDEDHGFFLKYLYEEAILHNWNRLYLANALQFAEKQLIKNEVYWLFTDIAEIKLSPLKTNTLYIPDYTLVKFNAFSGDESKRHEVKKLLKKYPYPYSFISTEELIAKAESSEEPVYYLSYIKSSTNKFISIIDAKTGEFLYSTNSPMSYNIKPRDFGYIAESVED